MMGIGLAELAVILFILLVLVLPPAVLWIWVLQDCIRHEPLGPDRTTWILTLVLTGAIGAVVYLILRRPHRSAEQTDCGA